MDKIYNGFKRPSCEYSMAAFWFWNGMLQKEEIKRQIKEMNEKGVYHAFMHARARLITPYLSDEWWDIIYDALCYAENIGFHLWIYDEYAWPSGTAGSTFIKPLQTPSRVLALGKKNYAKGLKYSIRIPDEHGDIRLDVDNVEAIEAILKINVSGDCIVDRASIIDITPYAGSYYHVDDNSRAIIFYRYAMPNMVDYLNEDTIKDFINLTHEEYKCRFSRYFGNVIPGVFFDEIYNAGRPLTWTDDFADEFMRIKGYDIISNLPLLIYDGEGSETVRFDYFDVLTHLYEKAFFKQIGQWCEQNNLLLTGHTEEEISSHPLRQGHYFRTQKHLQIPGTDCHCFRYTYPRRINPVEAKVLSSVGHIYRKKRIMSEALGGAGWAITLEDFKYGTNMLFALGINFMILHGFHYTLDDQGAMDDWPNSWFYQNPYWRYFKICADYVSRLSYMGTIGHHVCDIALLYPIATMWVNTADGLLNPKGRLSASIYDQLIRLLFAQQLDFDVVDEESIKTASLINKCLKIAEESYKVLILPPIDMIDHETANKVVQFYREGGIVFAVRYLPVSSPLTCIFELRGAEQKGYTMKENTAGGKAYFINDDINLMPLLIEQAIGREFKIVKGDDREFYYMHRREEQVDYYFMVNALNRQREITVEVTAKGIPYILHPEDGSIKAIENYKHYDDKTQVKLSFESNEAFYVVFYPNKLNVVRQLDRTAKIYKVDGMWEFIPVDANVNLPYDKSPDISRSLLDIPVMEFKDESDEQWQLIKVKNRSSEPGCCGRYLTNWRAKWITYRTGWADGGYAQRLYFRKDFTLDDVEGIVSAPLTMSAVNRGQLWINGCLVKQTYSWDDIADLDARSYLKTGRNTIAVLVDNPETLGSTNDLQRDKYEPQWLTSLLLEMRIDYKNGASYYVTTDNSWIVTMDHFDDWNRVDSDFSDKTIAYRVNDYPNPYRSFKGTWVYAWERGKPPIQPWGHIPLHGQKLAFPREVWYKQRLPIGTAKVYEPSVKGEYELYIDGKLAEFTGGICWLEPVDRCRELMIKVIVHDFADGLIEPIRIECVPTYTSLIPWAEKGLNWFSGRGLYTKSVHFNKEDVNDGIILDMGDVRFFAEVWVNGKPAGVRLWKPYSLDITDYVHEGQNEISILVSNLLANRMRWDIYDEVKGVGWNRYWHEDNIERDKQNLISGMIVGELHSI